MNEWFVTVLNYKERQLRNAKQQRIAVLSFFCAMGLFYILYKFLG